MLSGIPLEWKRPCVSFSVQRDASPLREITYDDAHRIINDAYAKWLASSCETGLPSLDIADFGDVSCREPRYNSGGPNANVWMFHDDDWDRDGVGGRTFELAITIVTFNPDTGEIFDADVVVNSHEMPITIGDDHVQYDLASIVTHEAGHFLGLSHSRVPGATMREGYATGTTSLRDLSADDEAGMCAMYPPDRAVPSGNCTPRHGFSSSCTSEDKGGCALATTSTLRPRTPWAAGLALVGFGAWLRRQRTTGTPGSRNLG